MRILDSFCVFGRWPKEERDVSLEKLLAVLDGLGIEKALCVSLCGVFYDAAEGNAETLKAAAADPRIIPAATMNPKSYFSRENLPAELAAKGFRALRLFPNLQGWSSCPSLEILSPHNVLLERIFNECAEARLPIAFPVGKFPDVASFLLRLAPKGCRVILSDVYYNELAESVEVLRRRPEFFMEMGHTCVPGSIELLCREVGAGRLMLGTNQPLEIGRGAIESIKRAEISGADKAAILGGTLAGLLGGI
jgi:predicted TIM-barrel fold metal-dependent hydrolase